MGKLIVEIEEIMAYKREVSMHKITSVIMRKNETECISMIKNCITLKDTSKFIVYDM